MTNTYPASQGDVQQLVREHLKLHDEPLLLAIYYAPKRDQEDIFLFEVIDGFGANSIDSERTLFEVTYSSTAGFPLQPGQKLHLVLTNPREFSQAVGDSWPGITELRDAVQRGDFSVLHQDPGQSDLLERLKK